MRAAFLTQALRSVSVRLLVLILYLAKTRRTRKLELPAIK